MSFKKLLIAAGGSGGHLFPAQQLIEKLKEKNPNIEILFGGHDLSKNPFFATDAFSFCEIPAAMPKNVLKFLINSWKGFWKSFFLIRSFRPDIVIGFGSYHVFSVLLASVVLRKKIILFEANCILGKVNRMFAPFSTLAHQFPLYAMQSDVFVKKEKKNQVLVSPFPWKKQDLRVTKEEACLHYGLNPKIPTILVFGGSQGASFLNEVMPKAISLLSLDVQVLHFTGKGLVKYPRIVHVVKPFEKEMHFAYAAADVVVCRSGAATLGELILHQKRALFIPFPTASDNHQWVNAHFFVQKLGGGSILIQKEGSPERIAEEINTLLQEKQPVQRQVASHAVNFEDLIT